MRPSKLNAETSLGGISRSTGTPSLHYPWLLTQDVERPMSPFLTIPTSTMSLRRTLSASKRLTKRRSSTWKDCDKNLMINSRNWDLTLSSVVSGDILHPASAAFLSILAVVAETVVGATTGVVPPPKGYFRAMKSVCDKYGALFILDEVMSGMGRTSPSFS